MDEVAELYSIYVAVMLTLGFALLLVIYYAA